MFETRFEATLELDHTIVQHDLHVLGEAPRLDLIKECVAGVGAHEARQQVRDRRAAIEVDVDERSRASTPAKCHETVGKSAVKLERDHGHCDERLTAKSQQLTANSHRLPAISYQLPANSDVAAAIHLERGASHHLG